MPNHTPGSPGVSFPLCYADARTFMLWQKSARQSLGLGPTRELPPMTYCEDCTYEYQAQMKLEGRCANPDFPLGIFA